MLAPLMLASCLGAAPYSHDVEVAEEFRPRDGLPNLFAKLQAGGPVRIAYLGGSITAAAGWRPKTLAWFKAQYPAAEVAEINAAISGTGSDFGACRVRGDVLAQLPDLVFLECRVNGGGGFERQSVEGIVRQVWKQSPRTDICFVYTIGPWMLKDLQAGKAVPFSRIMEGIANLYGIPTIDLGVEIAKREKEGSLVFQSAAPVEGKLVFSGDGVHPGEAGHEVYRDVIARSLLQIKGTTLAQDHTLPPALDPTCWETTALLPVTAANPSPGWTAVDTATDAVYGDDRGRTEGMLRGAMSCTRAGETFTVKWSGTTLGMSDIPYGEPCVVEAVVDGGTPFAVKRVQTEKIRKYARFWYLPELPPGEHTAVFTVKEIPAGARVYVGQFLVVGTPRP
jgi:lysophospholipase L1-like esterase